MEIQALSQSELQAVEGGTYRACVVGNGHSACVTVGGGMNTEDALTVARAIWALQDWLS
jgi:hypothetical protein